MRLRSGSSVRRRRGWSYGRVYTLEHAKVTRMYHGLRTWEAGRAESSASVQPRSLEDPQVAGRCVSRPRPGTAPALGKEPKTRLTNTWRFSMVLNDVRPRSKR